MQNINELKELENIDLVDKMYVSFNNFNNKTLNYSDLDNTNYKKVYETADYTFPVYLVRLATFSDYDNICMIERSNKQYLVEYCEENNIKFFEVWGMYGSESIALPVKSLMNNKLYELIASLSDYPLLDEILFSSMEHDVVIAYIENEYSYNDYSVSIEQLIEYALDNYEIEAGGNVYIKDLEQFEVKE